MPSEAPFRVQNEPGYRKVNTGVFVIRRPGVPPGGRPLLGGGRRALPGRLRPGAASRPEQIAKEHVRKLRRGPMPRRRHRYAERAGVFLMGRLDPVLAHLDPLGGELAVLLARHGEDGLALLERGTVARREGENGSPLGDDDLLLAILVLER